MTDKPISRTETAESVPLLPCPFCGSEYTQVRYIGWKEPCAFDSGYRGECCDCHAITTAYPTEAEAFVAWNTRAQTVFGMTLDDVRQMMKRDAERERTCHDADTRFNAWTCSECKCTQLLMFDDYGEPTLNVDGVASVPNYCPNCGAKVVDA